jgi:hypothetical protein
VSSNTVNSIAILKSCALFNLRRLYRRHKLGKLSSDNYAPHIENLRRNGYSVIPGYISSEVCAELRSQVDSAIVDYPKALWTGLMGADERIFGINLCGGGFGDFFNDHYLQEVGERYFGCQITNLQTLAGRIGAIEGNIGSGEGWHRDATNCQYKAIIYLNDVNADGGPFQFIAKSHHLGRILRDSAIMNLDDYLNTRFTDSQVNRILKREPERLITFTAPAGTVLLVDTSAIHRGSPILAGRRYALFNYYYPYYDVEGRLEKFTPRLLPEMLSDA